MRMIFHLNIYYREHYNEMNSVLFDPNQWDRVKYSKNAFFSRKNQICNHRSKQLIKIPSPNR